MIDRKAIKAYARQVLKRNLWPLIGAFALAVLLPAVCLGGGSGFSNAGTLSDLNTYSYGSGYSSDLSDLQQAGDALSEAMTEVAPVFPIVIGALIFGLMVGLIIGLVLVAISYLGEGAYARMSLMAYDGVPVQINDLLGIKGYWLKVIGLYFMITLRILMWMLPLYIPGLILILWNVLSGNLNIFVSLLSGVFILGSILHAIKASLLYLLAPYLLFEDSSKGINQVINESKIQMKGYIMQMVVFYLSFFWWYVLVAVTCGLAALYVGPYVALSVAGAYRAIRSQQEQNTAGTIPEAGAVGAFGVPTHVQSVSEPTAVVESVLLEQESVEQPV